MIYTSYDMCRDCRADRPEGWSYFLSNYVPIIRRLLSHYGSADDAVMNRVLLGMGKPESSLFQSLEPVPERWFLAELRQHVLGALDVPPAEIVIDLEIVAAALEPLTMVEKLGAWTETMCYPPEPAGTMLRISPATVEKIRGRAAELIRGKIDAWRRSLLADNGAALGREAAGSGGNECLSAKTFLDILDGRMTWQGREELERHVNSCWHCIDHFCRMLEVVEVSRGVQPLSAQEAEPYRALLGVQQQKPSMWRRFF